MIEDELNKTGLSAGLVISGLMIRSRKPMHRIDKCFYPRRFNIRRNPMSQIKYMTGTVAILL
jgi:hypothetical protein